MNSEPKPDWEQKLEEIEQRISQSPVRSQASNWFNNLSKPVQVAVVVGGAFVVFSVLNIFLKIVTSILTLAVLAGILYLLYRFLFASKSNGN